MSVLGLTSIISKELGKQLFLLINFLKKFINEKSNVKSLIDIIVS